MAVWVVGAFAVFSGVLVLGVDAVVDVGGCVVAVGVGGVLCWCLS